MRIILVLVCLALPACGHVTIVDRSVTVKMTVTEQLFKPPAVQLQAESSWHW